MHIQDLLTPTEQKNVNIVPRQLSYRIKCEIFIARKQVRTQIPTKI